MSNTRKTFFDLINEYKIIIPLIQRDYAQGRLPEKQKAENFLQAIKSGCVSQLNLDFVYGKTNQNNNDFIPLDGQQRLTTLFLIHWYLSLENKYIDNLKNFSYEVRSSTKDFIQELTNEVNWEILYRDNIQEQLENSNWFFLSWKNDPTVVAILNMLTLIEKYFNEVKIEQLQNVTFEVLYLDEFNLTDELYVKMNARGKPLTMFENFKAEFESYIEVSDENPINIEKNKAKLDNEWLNIFWNLAKEDVDNIEEAPRLADQMFYNFFYNMTFNFYLEENDTLTCKGIEYKVISDKGNKGFIQNCTLFDFYKEVYEEKTKVIELIKLLDTLKSDKFFKVFVSKIDISQWDRARFYALSLGYIHDLDEEEFNRWKKISFNLINNQLIQSPDDIRKTIQSLKQLIKESNFDIYGFIANESENINKYFTKVQREEESLKTHLVLENENWEQVIRQVENNWYLDGQIGFLLDFANNKLEDFVVYSDKFQALWNFAKNENSEMEKNNQILIYQALLTKGNYLPNISSNKTFCSFEPALRTKNDNWRKVFNSKQSVIIKKLLDDTNFDSSHIESSLNLIIEKSEITDFTKYFIKNKSYIEYCKKLQIRYVDDKQVYLLKTTQMNGTHSELFSWDLFVNEFELIQKSERKIWWRLESQKTFNPFQTTWYYESTSWHNPPSIVLSDFKFEKQNIQLDIGYKGDGFYLSLYDENDKELHDDILNVIKILGFNEDNIKENICSDSILLEIEQICTKLNELQE